MKRKLVLGIVASLLLVVVFMFTAGTSALTPTEEANKAVIRDCVAKFWNAGNVDVIGEFYSTDLINHDPTRPLITNFEEFKASKITGFPKSSITVTIVYLIAEGDLVAKLFTSVVTPKATGISRTGAGCTVYQLKDGLIIGIWPNRDDLGTKLQLGWTLVPPPADPPTDRIGGG